MLCNAIPCKYLTQRIIKISIYVILLSFHGSCTYYNDFGNTGYFYSEGSTIGKLYYFFYTLVKIDVFIGVTFYRSYYKRSEIGC